MTGVSGIAVAVATCDRPDALRSVLYEAILTARVDLPAEIVVVDQGEHAAGLEEPAPGARGGPSRSRPSGAPWPLGLAQSSAGGRLYRAVVAFTDDDCVPNHR